MDRFQRLIRKETQKEPLRGAEAQWFRDMVYIEKLETTIEWCNSKKIDVFFAKKPNGVYEPSTKVVLISGRALPEKQLHYLLHECGHHLIGLKEQHERFGMGYHTTMDPEARNNHAHRIACLEEEFEAWYRGWKLSRRLGLDVDREEFDKTRVDCLRSYIKWASSRVT